jgi:hypothetical protein
VELTEYYPERVVGSEPDGELVVVLRPRYLRGPLAWWLQPRLSRPYFRVHLDGIGSFVWKQCDGRTSVAQIAAAMEDHFGEQEAQLFQRLVYFLRELERGQMIRMLEQPAEQPGPVEPG